MMIVQPSRFSAGGGGSPITVSSNWGTTSAGTATITSFARTLTVPVGNPGSVLLNLTIPPGFLGSVQYQLAGGSLTTFTDGTTISVVTTNTLAFRALSMSSSDEVDITVTDNSNATQIGFSTLIRT